VAVGGTSKSRSGTTHLERAVIIRSERLGRTSLADVEETLRLLDQVLADNAKEMEKCEPELATG
jgi:hypothetical protein